jgi:iron complex outermembrane receptor protein
MRTTRSLAVALLTFAAFAAGVTRAEAAGSLSGRVTDAAGQPIPGVEVSAGTQVAHTDADGNWTLGGLEAGSYEVSFAAGSFFASAAATVVEGVDSRLDQSFDWDLAGYAEELTVISASRREERIVEAPAAVTMIPAIEIERRAATAQLPKLLEFSPGVEVTQSGIYDYNLNTRGFNSSLNRRVATVIDGRDPSVPFLGSQEWASTSFPLDDLARLEFVRGPSAALYGANASSGVLNMITKRPRDSQGGMIRLTGGELSTFNADARWAMQIAGDWYGKLLAGHRQSGDFTVSRRGAAEYSVPCGAGRTTDCLPQEAVFLNPEDDDEISIASARVDRHYGDTSLLTLEGGWADVTGPVFQTGIGRVQLVDVERRWARLNFSTPHWNVMGASNGRDAPDQTALSTGRNLLLDEEAWRGEIQTNWAFRDDSLRLVAGLSYEDKDIDSADHRSRVRPRLFGLDADNVKNLRQTLLFEPIKADSTAFFAQADWNLGERVKLVLAGRYDDSTLHDVQISPKGALVFSLTPSSSIRLTYNQAFQVPNYSEFFLQAEVAPAVPFDRLPCAPGSTVAGIPCTTGFINLEEVCALDGVRCGFDTDFEFGEIAVPETEPDNVGDTLILALGNSNLEVEEVETWEIGYTGVLGGKLLLTLDYYNSKNENFITDLLPQLGTPLGRINPEFGPYQLPPGLTAQHQQQILAILQAVLGPLRPFLSQNFDRTPIVAVRSYTNFGQVDTQGADLGLEWYLTPEWTLHGSYSWFDFEIQDSVPGLDQLLLPNAPENKYAVGLSFANARFDASLSYRWVEEFRWVVGPFQGQVPDYGTADLVANVQISDHFALGINVANVLDDEHWESFGGDLLGRRALGSVTFSW